MKEAETFYWKNENGEITEHNISEFGTFLERETGSCVSSVEYKQKEQSRPERTGAHGMVEGNVLSQRGGTKEKEIKLTT